MTRPTTRDELLDRLLVERFACDTTPKPPPLPLSPAQQLARLREAVTKPPRHH